ncbi:hypothetical protein RF55_6663 [Lasius niger]|uniref:Uncharacterized protein n=1 Tax=Lasius niger TaxID=67767 RepID=A0A0J7KS71_LASNI|nr:hypothetical protein RF55_6663 [Lasius niger]
MAVGAEAEEAASPSTEISYVPIDAMNVAGDPNPPSIPKSATPLHTRVGGLEDGAIGILFITLLAVAVLPAADLISDVFATAFSEGAVLAAVIAVFAAIAAVIAVADAAAAAVGAAAATAAFTSMTGMVAAFLTPVTQES